MFVRNDNYSYNVLYNIAELIQMIRCYKYALKPYIKLYTILIV